MKQANDPVSAGFPERHWLPVGFRLPRRHRRVPAAVRRVLAAAEPRSDAAVGGGVGPAHSSARQPLAVAHPSGEFEAEERVKCASRSLRAAFNDCVSLAILQL